MIFRIVFCLLLILFYACETESEKQRYIGIAHTRICDGSPPDVPDNRMAKLDLASYDIRLLLGDMACNSSKRTETLLILDSLFDMSNPATLFAIGNHDSDDPISLSTQTQRPGYYTYSKNGIVFLILDTQLDQCRILGEQLALFEAVTDTISESKHLIILHHKLIWMPGHPQLAGMIDSVSNIGLCNSGEYCLFEHNNFYQDLYPRLEHLSENGVNVICLGGDIGIKSKSFEWDFNPNFHLLATGVNDESPGDRVLIFEHDLGSDQLTWAFTSIDSLVDLE